MNEKMSNLYCITFQLSICSLTATFIVATRFPWAAKGNFYYWNGWNYFRANDQSCWIFLESTAEINTAAGLIRRSQKKGKKFISKVSECVLLFRTGEVPSHLVLIFDDQFETFSYSCWSFLSFTLVEYY